MAKKQQPKRVVWNVHITPNKHDDNGYVDIEINIAKSLNKMQYDPFSRKGRRKKGER